MVNPLPAAATTNDPYGSFIVAGFRLKDFPRSQNLLSVGQESGGCVERANTLRQGHREIERFNIQRPTLRIPSKSDTCSNSNRTLIPIDVGQLSERSDALGLVIKKCPV